jgi:molybdate transport system substrate-binding protein
MRRILPVAILLLFSFWASSEELSIAAAADLNFALKEIAQKYQQRTGNSLQLSFGSSGNFFVQIQNGAPFDIFFSADIDYPKKLEHAGLAEPCTLSRYAQGKIVLWVPSASTLDISRGLHVLLDPAVKKIAIANPQHAPYGRAAEEALKEAGVYERVKDKLVIGENISQTAQFVQTGNADVGIIALSLAMAPPMKSEGRFEEVRTDLYAPIDQGLVVLKSSKKKDAARSFLNYLRTDDAQQILRKYGFRLVNDPNVCGS